MRLIDGDALYDEIHGGQLSALGFEGYDDYTNINNIDDALDAVKYAPTIQPKPHWNPVDLENNEPPLEEWVLVSSDGYVMQDCIVERGGKKIWYHGGNIQSDDRYMPLPEPYKGVTE